MTRDLCEMILLVTARGEGRAGAAVGRAARKWIQRAVERITDERVRRIASRKPIGSIDQFSDSTDLVSHAAWRATLRNLYE